MTSRDGTQSGPQRDRAADLDRQRYLLDVTNSFRNTHHRGIWPRQDTAD